MPRARNSSTTRSASASAGPGRAGQPHANVARHRRHPGRRDDRGRGRTARRRRPRARLHAAARRGSGAIGRRGRRPSGRRPRRSVFLVRRAPPRARPGAPVPRGDRPRPGAHSGEGRGKRRGPADAPARSALIYMVSPVGLEPTAPRLKISCSREGTTVVPSREHDASAGDHHSSQLSVVSCPRNHFYRTLEQTMITRRLAGATLVD